MKNKIIDIKNMGKIEFLKLRCNNKNKFGNPIKEYQLLKKVNSDKIKESINNEYILKILPKNKKMNVYFANPKNLLSSHRFDIFIKSMYVEAFDKNINLDIAKNIYLDHIKAFNNFSEPDTKKDGKEEFLNSFNRLIGDIKKDGFKDFYIPISRTGEIIDGAHRLAVAYYYNINVKFIILDALDADYNYNFFIKRNFKRENLNLVIKYLLEKEEWALIVTTDILKMKKKIDIYYEMPIKNKEECMCLIRREDVKKLKNEKVYIRKRQNSIFRKFKRRYL